jgi:glycosyltransferase involved in cell wall biosynthesis
MKILTHLPLERLKERYTEFLADWELAAFKEAGFTVEQLVPKESNRVTMKIVTGEILDSVNRPIYCFKQMIKLMRILEGAPSAKIYFSDFFTPGLEALPYSRRNFEASSFLWAQSFDQYDFTAGMIPWMRPWEFMALSIYKNVFVACDFLKELILSAAPDAESKIHVVGLPFNSRHVGQLWDKGFSQGRDFACVYSSRLDKEKNPQMFLDLVKACPDLEFALCTPYDRLRGTAATQNFVKEADDLKNLTIFFGVSKEEYYAVLHASRVQFNSSLQDWVSFTLLEALTYDCLPLYPSFRAFPEVFEYDQTFLYRPFDLESAVTKLRFLLDSDLKPPTDILEHHDGTLTRIAEILQS